MTKNEKIIIAFNALFTLASGMSAVFMNVFLYTYTESLSVMAMYTCVYIAATLYGIGVGFYYLSLNTLNQWITTPASRNRYLSIGGVLNNFANVIAPLISSFIIDYATIYKYF